MTSQLTVLTFDFSDPESNKPGMEDTTLLLTVAVFIVSSPPTVVKVPTLFMPCVEIFKNAWDTKDCKVCKVFL